MASKYPGRKHEASISTTFWWHVKLIINDLKNKSGTMFLLSNPITPKRSWLWSMCNKNLKLFPY